jgi:outer membrane protein assembly factor BamA
VFFLPLLPIEVNAENQTLDTLKQKNVFQVLPVVYFTSETRWVLEVFSYKTFKLSEKSSLSSLKLFLNASQEKQYSFLLPFQVFSKHDKYLFLGRIELSKYPEYFYGVGNKTTHQQREKYIPTLFSFQAKALKNLDHRLFLGVNLMFRQIRTDLLGLCNAFNDKSRFVGINGYRGGSIGPSIIFDSRDHILNPYRGIYFDLSLTTAFGEEFSQKTYAYNSATADFRYFIPLYRKHIFATHIVVESNSGNMPYRDMSVLGGPKNLRGYFYGRFRDNHLCLIDTELRSNIKGRIGMVVFGGAGSVASHFKYLFSNQWHISYGFGLRYQLNKNDRANVRADLAFGKDSRSINLLFAEAF